MANITFTNDSNVVFNGAGEYISGIEFTTGSNRTIFNVAPTAIATNGSYGTGVEMVWSAAEQSNKACLNTTGGCASPTQITDSAGGSWTSRDYCTHTPNGPSNLPAASTDVCLITLIPAGGVVLAPGASITVTGMQFWANGGSNTGWPCYNTPCTGLTTILPTHGIDWSLTSNPTAPTAWTPVQFGSVNSANAKPSGTAQIDYVGSTPGGSSAYVAQQQTTRKGRIPGRARHFYQANFSRADYQNSTPWTPDDDAQAKTHFLSSFRTTRPGNSPQNENRERNLVRAACRLGFPSYISTSFSSRS